MTLGRLLARAKHKDTNIPTMIAVAAVAFGRCPAPSHRHRLVDCWICPCHRCGPPIPMHASRSGFRLVFGLGTLSSSRRRRPDSLFHRLDGCALSSSGREPLSSSSSPPDEAPSVAPVAHRLWRAPTSEFVRAVVAVVVAPPPRDAHQKDSRHRSVNRRHRNRSHGARR